MVYGMKSTEPTFQTLDIKFMEQEFQSNTGELCCTELKFQKASKHTINDPLIAMNFLSASGETIEDDHSVLLNSHGRVPLLGKMNCLESGEGN